MDSQLAERCVLITGGAHGIGEATSALMTREGANTFVVDIDAAALEEKKKSWAGWFAADLSTADGVSKAVDAALEHFGRPPDILVNNVGVASQEPFATLTDDAWLFSHQLNLMASVRFCRALLPNMAKNPGSAVINVSSDLAKQPEPMPMEYGAAKAALIYLTKGLAKEYAPNVRVNCVSPGPVWTRLWSRPGGVIDQLAAQYDLSRDDALAKYLESRYMPLGFAQPEDVANAIVFLASPLAERITGVALDVGGTIRGLL